MSARRGTLGLAAGLWLGLGACGEPTHADAVRKTIGPEGGLITSHDGVLTIVLLPGALSSEVEVEVFPSDEPPPIFGLTYRVRPDIELMFDAQVSYHRVLPSNPNAATIGAIHLDDYTGEMGYWRPLPRLSLDVEEQLVTATDDELALYYGLLEDADAPPLPTGGNDDTPPPDDTTGSESVTTGDETTMPGTTAVDPSTSGPSESTGGSMTTATTATTMTTAGTTDEGGESSSGGMMMAVCGDGMPVVGELCLVAGADYATGLDPIDVAVGAFDGVAGLDVVTLDAGALELGLLSGNGNGTLQAPVTAAALGGMPVEMVAGDMTGDGVPDVAVLDTAADAVGLLVGDGMGGFAAPVNTVAGVGVVDLDIGAFNGDAAQDVGVLLGTDQTLQLLLGGPGMLTLGGVTGVNAGVNATVAIGDYNGAFDMFDDIMGLGPGGFHAWATNGTGLGFLGAVANAFGGGGTFVELVAGDVNGDGNDDVAAIDIAGDTMVVGLSTGGPASFNFQPPVAVGTDPSDIVLYDLDGDGDAEAVVCNAGSNDVMVLDWNGAAYVLAFTFPAGMGPSGVAVGELDGDGVPDVVVSSAGSDTVTVLVSDP
ncbi:MAG: VCBS repeat-containing protein [Myxococcales bacterium]|nr:VCBS repeat-containing protein [Myxococcales bacterium]